jgi:hypothetical protein
LLAQDLPERLTLPARFDPGPRPGDLEAPILKIRRGGCTRAEDNSGRKS